MMELLISLTLLLILDLLAFRWGRDSRDPTRGHAGTGGILPGREA